MYMCVTVDIMYFVLRGVDPAGGKMLLRIKGNIPARVYVSLKKRVLSQVQRRLNIQVKRSLLAITSEEYKF